MNSPSSAPAALLCEVAAESTGQARTISRIAAECAADLGQSLVIRTMTRRRRAARPGRTSTGEGVVTLYLPAELAATQHAIWCLACRLACFCPSVHVNVVVRCEDSFPARSTSATPPALAA